MKKAKDETQFDLNHVTGADLDATLTARLPLFTQTLSIEATALTWTAVQGALQLAMRHPKFNSGPSREMVEEFANGILALLVELGAFTEAEVGELWKQETVIQKAYRADDEGKPLIIIPGEIVCLHCGCTDRHACANNCHWVEVNRDAGVGVCSNCAEGEDAG